MSQSDQAAQARIAELEQQLATVTDRLEQANDHIAIAFHPEIGWAVTPEQYSQLYREHDELKDVVRSVLPLLPDGIRAQLHTQHGVFEKMRLPDNEL